MLGGLRARVGRFGGELSHAMSAMTEESPVAFITALDDADRVLALANGLSIPLGLDMMLRLQPRPVAQPSS